MKKIMLIFPNLFRIESLDSIHPEHFLNRFEGIVFNFPAFSTKFIRCSPVLMIGSGALRDKSLAELLLQLSNIDSVFGDQGLLAGAFKGSSCTLQPF